MLIYAYFAFAFMFCFYQSPLTGHTDLMLFMCFHSSYLIYIDSFICSELVCFHQACLSIIFTQQRPHIRLFPNTHVILQRKFNP